VKGRKNTLQSEARHALDGFDVTDDHLQPIQRPADSKKIPRWIPRLAIPRHGRWFTGPVTEFLPAGSPQPNKDGKTYIYHDAFPTIQDPHVYIDDDLTDGKPAKHGPRRTRRRTALTPASSAILRAASTSSTKTGRRSCQQTLVGFALAGHAVSDDGVTDWKLLPPAVDNRTSRPAKPRRTSPHWAKTPGTKWHRHVQRPRPGAGSITATGPPSPSGPMLSLRRLIRRRCEMAVGWFT
jgi:hypothetical protein